MGVIVALPPRELCSAARRGDRPGRGNGPGGGEDGESDVSQRDDRGVNRDALDVRGEVGGCQAEGGSAACMTAAALVDLAGGTLTQSVAAASMAFQSMLGLICDPIANRVEARAWGRT